MCEDVIRSMPACRGYAAAMQRRSEGLQSAEVAAVAAHLWATAARRGTSAPGGAFLRSRTLPLPCDVCCHGPALRAPGCAASLTSASAGIAKPAGKPGQRVQVSEKLEHIAEADRRVLQHAVAAAADTSLPPRLPLHLPTRACATSWHSYTVQVHATQVAIRCVQFCRGLDKPCRAGMGFGMLSCRQ